MLMLRRAQLERELQRQRHHLLGVEARLRHIAQEDDMPADDVVVKQIPPLGVVVIADTSAAGWDTQDLVAGYQPHWPGRRDIWIHEVDDISEADQQVFEVQLAFTRPTASALGLDDHPAVDR